MAHKNFMTRLSRFRWRGLKTIAQNEEGVSAMEFALIAPFMVLLYFGGVELSLLMQADRRVTSAASTMGDIASRATSINNNDMQEIFGSSRVILQPLDFTVARMRISSLIADEDGVVTVDWSDAQNFSPRATGSTVTGLPDGVVPGNGSVIYAEMEYDYASELDFFLQNTRTIREDFYLRPRRVDVIPRTN